MFDDQDNIFDIPHSLPSSSHMTAVSTRTPTGITKIDSNRYMPDYGGILEVPGTKTKQCGLRIGIPFDTNPYYVRVIPEDDEPESVEPRSPECIVATSYLKSGAYDDRYKKDKSFSIIRAIGKTLYLDLVESIPCEVKPPEIHNFSTYAHVPYPYKISGLKYCDTIDNYVIVKFVQGIKLIKLNDCYRIPPKIQLHQDDCESDSDETEIDESESNIPIGQSAVNSIDSFAETQGVQVRDASLSKSQSWLYIASRDSENLYVKLYDLCTSKQCYNKLTKIRDDDIKIRVEQSKKQNTDRRKSLRSFIPSKPSFEELQQIICDPNHLINSLMVTSNRVALIDPRESTIVMNYADRYKMLSISPTERFKQVEFSCFNHQQFYLMSDERLRAMDKRYPSKELNIVEHMIESATYDMMTMKLTAPERKNYEILCLSSFGRICILSFDQSCYTHTLLHEPGNLINPRSMHHPIHEHSPTEISGQPTDELYGLAVSSKKIFDSRDVLFSTLQLSQEGDVCIRGFLTPRDKFLEFENQSARPMLRIEDFSKQSTNSNICENPANPSLKPRGELGESSGTQTPGVNNQLNILDPNHVIEAEKLLTTKRAKTKYDWIKKKLR